jgi:metal-responsive CopG/Arc/MetJ family transcriptional regulator
MEPTSERITLRLERENLEQIDEFLKDNEEIDSRSQLCRMALQNYLREVERSADEVTVKVPAAYLDYIDELVRAGYFESRQQAIVRCLEGFFSREGVARIERHLEVLGIAAGKSVAVYTEGSRKPLEP